METLLSWSPLVLYTCLRHSLRMMCHVTAVVAQQRHPRFLPCGSAWRDLGRMPRLAGLLGGYLVVRLAGLLGGDLVISPSSQTCSVGTLSYASALWTCSANGLERGLWASPWVPRFWAPTAATEPVTLGFKGKSRCELNFR